MFKFLFGTKPGTVEKVETQREAFARLTSELEGFIDTLTVKPTLEINPNTGAIRFTAPDQFPDEALALPAPSDAETTGDTNADAPTPPKPAAPKPTAPKATAPKPKAPAKASDGK